LILAVMSNIECSAGVLVLKSVKVDMTISSLAPPAPELPLWTDRIVSNNVSHVLVKYPI
jgi:hypothetical protein